MGVVEAVGKERVQRGAVAGLDRRDAGVVGLLDGGKIGGVIGLREQWGKDQGQEGKQAG